ncbi:MAG: hypothetical protein QF609_12260 [Gammaproteobacteria bacterium]|nr:hypothetical protein [Gammaproteobacteria bacterium]
MNAAPLFCEARAAMWAPFFVLICSFSCPQFCTAQNVVVALEVVGGKIDGSDVIRLTQGDQAELRWRTDQAIDIHLHGYDIEQSLKPGADTAMVFVAHATGRFPIVVHDPNAVGDHADAHSHGGAERTLVYLEVHPD